MTRVAKQAALLQVIRPKAVFINGDANMVLQTIRMLWVVIGQQVKDVNVGITLFRVLNIS